MSLLEELEFGLSRRSILLCDNIGAGALASSPMFHTRTKHIDIDVHYVQDQVINNKLEVSLCFVKRTAH